MGEAMISFFRKKKFKIVSLGRAGILYKDRVEGKTLRVDSEFFGPPSTVAIFTNDEWRWDDDGSLVSEERKDEILSNIVKFYEERGVVVELQ